MAYKKNSTAKASVIVALAVIFFIVCFGIVMFFDNDDDDGYALLPDYGMRFESMDVDIKWNDDRSCKITQSIDVKFSELSHGIYVDIPVNSGEMVRDLEITTTPSRPYRLTREGGGKIIRAVVGDPDSVFLSGDTMKCDIVYNYITPEHPSGADILAFNAIGGGWTCYTKKARVTMTYPVAPEKTTGDFGIWIGNEKFNDAASGVTVAWSNDGRTVTVDIGGRVTYRNFTFDGVEKFALAPFEKVELAYEMPSGTLRNYKNTEFIVTLCVGLAFLAMAIVLKLFLKNKPLTPVVDFYPPRIDAAEGKKRHMLPVQMGKIIDGSCSSADVTSLIFYWASKGYLAIEERDGETYFKKLKIVDAVTQYERNMFNKLFEKGEKNKEDGTVTVAMSDLKGKFGNVLKQTQTAVAAEYKGKLYKKSGIMLCAAMYILSAVFGFCITALTSLRIGTYIYAAAGIMSIIAVLLSMFFGLALVFYYNKLGNGLRNILTAVHFIIAVAMGVGIAAYVPNDVMTWLERIMFAVAFGVPTALAPFMIMRTQYYDEMLNGILGFRNFIRDAEKDKLEMLIADDPQYFYGILPYANVLGVSDVWEDKFKDITIEPPSYYYGNNVTLFDLVILNSLMKSVGSTLSYVPPSANKGSFSGGGGSSGGGFSGGSFGGGGGGRW